MIIDSHTHIGRNDHIRASAAELIASMDKAKIDQAMVFAGHLNDCPNQWMMEQIAPYKDRLHGVASVHLSKITAQHGTIGVQTDDMSLHDMLSTLRAGAKALKLYTGYEHFAPNSDRVRQVLELVQKSTDNRVVIFHTGDCLASITHAKLKYAQPLDIDDIAVDYPDFNFIIAHMGFPWNRDAAEVCYKNSNVYADISGFVYGDFKYNDHHSFAKTIYDFRDIAGLGKLLFGTDWPISNQEPYVFELKRLAEQNADAYESRMLTPEGMTENTKKAFKL